ncbi:MAG: hypothetical protein M5U34_23105 [Chloroflexi bacterium]|nr:hypothetical protein [Chloroflexota bacterium]
MTLANAGQIPASNIIATFISGSFVARDTGGVRAIGGLQPGEKARFWQPLAASADLAGQAIGTLEVKVDYTDSNGTAYSETFALTFPIVPQAVGRRRFSHAHSHCDGYRHRRATPAAATDHHRLHHQRHTTGARYGL